jgi:hypothetical protein
LSRAAPTGWPGTTLAFAVLVFAAWAVFLDAATHGWDNLKLLWLGGLT